MYSKIFTITINYTIFLTPKYKVYLRYIFLLYCTEYKYYYTNKFNNFFKKNIKQNRHTFVNILLKIKSHIKFVILIELNPDLLIYICSNSK